MSFDLSQLDAAKIAEQGAVLEVRHPVTGAALLTSENEPVTITVLGEDSSAYRRATHAAQNRRFARGNLTKLKGEELEQDQLEILAACTISWTGLALDGEDLSCNRTNALALYRRFKWLADQVSDFVRDRANFLPTSPSDTPLTSNTSIA